MTTSLRNGKGRGEELEEAGGRETIIKIYFMKKNLFSLKEKKESGKVGKGYFRNSSCQLLKQ